MVLSVMGSNLPASAPDNDQLRIDGISGNVLCIRIGYDASDIIVFNRVSIHLHSLPTISTGHIEAGPCPVTSASSFTLMVTLMVTGSRVRLAGSESGYALDGEILPAFLVTD